MAIEEADSELVKAIAKLALESRERPVPDTLTVQGVTYIVNTDGGLEAVGEAVPTFPEALQLQTLSSLADYLAANRDGLKLAELAIVVAGAQTVLLFGRVAGPLMVRPKLAAVTVKSLVGETGTEFAFGRFLQPETFVIGLQTLFAPSADRDTLLTVAGRLRASATQDVDDDGTSQAVTVRKGVSMGAMAKLPSPVLLAPWRTFREVEQPESPFIVRAQGGNENTLPQLALFEADGGAWRLEAIEAVAAKVRELLNMAVENADGGTPELVEHAKLVANIPVLA